MSKIQAPVLNHNEAYGKRLKGDYRHVIRKISDLLETIGLVNPQERDYLTNVEFVLAHEQHVNRVLLLTAIKDELSDISGQIDVHFYESLRHEE